MDAGDGSVIKSERRDQARFGVAAAVDGIALSQYWDEDDDEVFPYGAYSILKRAE